MKRKTKSVLAAVIPLIYILCILAGCGIYFETNDDRCMNEIFTGILSVQPDAHAVFVNYLLGLPMAWLNCLSTEIPWYGLTLLLFHYASYVLILHSMYDKCKSKGNVLVATLAMGVFWTLDIYMLGQIQFTTTAALLAVAGYTVLFEQKNTPKGFVLFFVFEFLGYMMRSQAMLMIQPIGFLTWAVLEWLSREEQRKIVKRLSISCLLLLSIVIIGEAGNFIGYHSQEWIAYDRYNTAIGYLLDFYQKPTYEEVVDILDSYGVTEAEYDACLSYAILDWSISPECAEELLAYVEANPKNTISLSELCVSLVKCNFGSGYWWIARAYVALTVLAFLYFLLTRSYRSILPLFAEVLAQEAVLAYLLWRGRTPIRVMLPVFIAGIIFVMLLIIMTYVQKADNKRQLIILGIMGCLVGVIIGHSAKLQYQYLNELAISQDILMQSMYELQEYCAERPELKYLIEENGQSYFRGSVLETKMYQERNSLTMGGWFTNSPCFLEKLNTYWGGDFEELRLIILETGHEMGHPAVIYLEELSGNTAKKVDGFQVSHGGRYAVYAFE